MKSMTHPTQSLHPLIAHTVLFTDMLQLNNWSGLTHNALYLRLLNTQSEALAESLSSHLPNTLILQLLELFDRLRQCPAI